MLSLGKIPTAMRSRAVRSRRLNPHSGPDRVRLRFDATRCDRYSGTVNFVLPLCSSTTSQGSRLALGMLTMCRELGVQVTTDPEDSSIYRREAATVGPDGRRYAGAVVSAI